jgi:PII-like signaling protein
LDLIMREVKRLEIVIDSLHVDQVLTGLRAAGVDGYTVVRGASGWGDRGHRQPDGVSGVFENCVVLCVVEPHLIGDALDRVRPILKRHGGVGVVSEAEAI